MATQSPHVRFDDFSGFLDRVCSFEGMPTAWKPLQSSKAIKFIDHQLSPRPCIGRAPIELNSIVDANQVVSRQANQTEGTRMVELIDEIDAD